MSIRVAGERWQEALKAAADRCEVVLFLVSPAWTESKWCLAEFLMAKTLHKRIFGLLVEAGRGRIRVAGSGRAVNRFAARWLRRFFERPCAARF
jgi:hypothetical protein